MKQKLIKRRISIRKSIFPSHHAFRRCKALITGLFIALSLILTAGGSYGQTQASMAAPADSTYKHADNELNATYQKILKEYSGQARFIKNIRKAQRLWIRLRDADLEAKYPDVGEYGSAEVMCRTSYMESLTRDRTNALKMWLDGIPEGDVCNGSVKIR